MNRPAVSAIITSFNQAPLIRASVESLQQQSYDGALEIIVVDSGSVDGSREILGQLDDPRVRVIHSDDDSSCAINRGRQAAHGDILVFSAADAIASRRRVAQHIEVMARGTCEVSASYPEFADGNGRKLRDADYWEYFLKAGVQPSLDIFQQLFYGGKSICLTTVAVGAACFDRIGGFHPALARMQGHDFLIRAAAAKAAFHISVERLSRRRIQRLDRASGAGGIEGEAERVYVLGRACDFLSEDDLRALYGRLVAPAPRKAQCGHLIPFVYMKHDDAAVRRGGLERLLDIFRDPDNAEQLDRLFGVRPQQVSARLEPEAFV